MTRSETRTRGARGAAAGTPRGGASAAVVLAALGVTLGALQWWPTAAGPGAAKFTAGSVSTGSVGERKVVRMASEDEIARAEAELKSAEQELQGKLTRSIPGGIKLASPEVGLELKRLREDVEAKRQRLDQLRKE